MATPAGENGSGIGRRGVAILGAWTLVAMLFAGQAWFAGQVRGEPLAWSRASAIWLAWAAAWAALTPVVLRLEARFPLQRPRILAALAVHGVASAACAAVSLALFALAAPVIGATQLQPTWLGTFSRLLGTTFLLHLVVYWLIVAAAHGERLVQTAREKDRRRLRLDVHAPRSRARGQSVAQRVLDEGLQDQVWHPRLEHLVRNEDPVAQAPTEAGLLDLEIVLEKGHLLAKRHLMRLGAVE